MCNGCSSCKGCGSAGGNRGDVDSMRHSHAAYEVRGSDYAVNGPHDMPSIARPLTLHNPATNQSESGYTAPSLSSALLRRALPSTVRQMAPIPYMAKFRGFIGGMINTGVKQIPIVPSTGYDGIMPLSQQPLIKKPLPYTG